MKRLLFILLAMLLITAPAEAYRAVASCPAATPIWASGATGVDPVIDVNGNICTSAVADTYMASTQVTASTTGTTAATAAALAATTGVTNYICGFSMRSNATAVATGNATVVGTISATMNFTHWTAALASNIGITTQTFFPCIPASAVNTAITVTSPAPGAGGTVAVTVWGYRK